MAISQSDGSIILTTAIDDSGIVQGTKNIKSSLKGIDSQTDSITAATKKYGKQTQTTSRTVKTSLNSIGVSIKGIMAQLAPLVGLYQLFELGKQSIELASDLQEVQNVVDVAFGDMAYKIEEFSKTSIEQFGLSELTAKKTASTYMAMAKSMGIAEDTASDMAIQLTGLSGDMSSFYNISQDVADTALKSIFTGETETLKNYGIVMTQTNLQQFAMSQGITKSIQSMTQQEQTMLRLNYVLQQTALAQGDFARTQGSWANQTRVLSERFKELLTILGSGLIQILTPVVQLLNLLISRIIDFANMLSSVISSLTGGEKKQLEMQGSSEQIAADNQNAADSAGQLTENNQSAADSAGDLADNITEAGNAAKKSLAPFDTLKILASNTSDAFSDMDFGPEAVGPEAVGPEAGGIFSPSVTEAQQKQEETAKNLEKELNVILDILTTIGLVLAGYKIADSAINFINTLQNFSLKGISLPLKIGLVIGGVGLFASTLAKVLSGESSATDLSTIISEGISGAMIGVGFASLAGAWIIPVAGILAIGIGEVIVNWENITGIWGGIIDAISALFNGDDEEFWKSVDDIMKNWISADTITLKLTGWIVDAIGGEGSFDRLKEMYENSDGNLSKMLFEIIKQSFSEQWSEKIAPWFTVDKWKEIFSNFGTAVSDWWDNEVTPWFTAEKWKEVFFKIGETLGEVMVGAQGIKKIWDDNIAPWWDEHVAPWFTVDKWKGIFSNIGTAISDFFVGEDGFLTKWGDNISEWWENNVQPWFTLDKWKQTFSNIGNAISEFFTQEGGFNKTWASNLGSWWENDVKPWFTLEKWTELGGNIIDGITSGVDSAIDGVKKLINSVIDGFQNLVNGAIGMLNAVIDGYNSIPGLPNLGKIQTVDLSKYKLSVTSGTELPKTSAFNESLNKSTETASSTAFLESFLKNQNANSSSSNNTVVIEIDGREFGRAVIEQGNKESRRIGAKLAVN